MRRTPAAVLSAQSTSGGVSEMTDATIPTPGTDELTVDPPAGKVIRPYVDESFLAATVLSDTELTKVENTTDAATATFGDPTSSKGELQVAVNNDYGGVRGPALDPSQFKEVRWGAVFRDDLSGGDQIYLGFWDTTGAAAPNTSSAYINQSTGTGTAQVRSGPGSDLSGLEFNALETAPRYLEVRLRPADGELRVISGGGDSVEDFVTDSSLELSGTHYPRIQIGTTSSGTENSFWLARTWLAVVHN